MAYLGAGMITSGDQFSLTHSQLMDQTFQRGSALLSRGPEKLGTIVASQTMSTIDKGSFKDEKIAIGSTQ